MVKMMSRKFLLTTILALPPVLAGIYLYLYGVDVLWADEFRFVDMVWAGHLPPWRELIALHIDHVILFPRIVYFYLAKFSSMNSLAVCWLSFALVCLLYLLVVRGAIRHFPGRTALFGLIVCLLVGVALFHPAQRENIFWGFQITYMMCFVFAGLSFFFFDLALAKERERNMPLLAAACCAVISSFSSSMGFVIWPVIIFSWLLISRKKALISYRFYLFCLLAVLVFGVFLSIRAEHGTHLGLFKVIQNPGAAINYFFALLDNACGNGQKPFVKGIVLFLAVLAICIHFSTRRSRHLLLPFMITAFGLGVSVLIALARCRFGWINALFPSSRYNLFPLTILWGVILYAGLLAANLEATHARPLRIVSVAAIILAGLWLFAGLPDHLEQTRLTTHPTLEKKAYLLRTIAFQTDEALGAFTRNVPNLRNLPRQLEEKRLSVYANEPIREPTVFGAASALPIADNTVAVDELEVKYSDQQGQLHIEGWLYDKTAHRQVESVWLNVGGRRFPLFYGEPSPDVADYFSTKTMELCGFVGDINLAVLRPGTYPLKLDAVNHGGSVWLEKDIGSILVFDGQRFVLRSENPPVKLVETLAPSACAVDGADISMDGDVAELVLWGWAYDQRTHRPIRHGWLQVGDQRIPLSMGVPRSDVARAFDDKKLLFTGFTAKFPLAGLAAHSSYPLRFEMEGRSGLNLYRSDNDFELTASGDKWLVRRINTKK